MVGVASAIEVVGKLRRERIRRIFMTAMCDIGQRSDVSRGYGFWPGEKKHRERCTSWGSYHACRDSEQLNTIVDTTRGFPGGCETSANNTMDIIII